ncbi:hypothetical protein D3C87_952650 [compost metagenome]
MRSNKLVVALVLIAIACTSLVSSFLQSWSERQEKARLENILSPVIAKSVEGTPDPKPSLSFISASDKSLMVVLRWEQKPEAPIKNDMREMVSTAVRRELSADPKSWGRHISVIFDDEVITQGLK